MFFLEMALNVGFNIPFDDVCDWEGVRNKVQVMTSMKAYIGMPRLAIRPLLWSSGQSSWLQIRRPGFDSRHYQKKK
jgi:hypothetical protein